MFRCHLFLELVHVASLSPRSTCIIIIISQVHLYVWCIHHSRQLPGGGFKNGKRDQGKYLDHIQTVSNIKFIRGPATESLSIFVLGNMMSLYLDCNEIPGLRRGEHGSCHPCMGRRRMGVLGNNSGLQVGKQMWKSTNNPENQKRALCNYI